jgi:hypothetical protein
MTISAPTLRRAFLLAGLVGGIVLSGVAITVARSEHRRAEAAIAVFEGRLADSRSELERVTERLEARDERIAFLEAELAAHMEQSDALTRELERQREVMAAEREATNERRRRPFRPMPEGVRLAVRTLEELLRDDGYDGFRILRAERLDGLVLHEVELLETDLESRRSTYYRAEQLAVELDRSTGAAVLRLVGGHAWIDGELAELPEGGLTIALPAVDGPAWEARMPWLVTARGSYPEPATRITEDEQLDALARAQWQERVDALLAEAGTDVRWQVARFRGLRDGWMLDVLVLGQSGGGLLERSAEADRVAIEVDRDAGTVALLLSGGTLHRKAGTNTIPESGYRIALPGVTAERAIGTMLGMVVDRTP